MNLLFFDSDASVTYSINQSTPIDTPKFKNFIKNAKDHPSKFILKHNKGSFAYDEFSLQPHFASDFWPEDIVKMTLFCNSKPCNLFYDVPKKLCLELIKVFRMRITFVHKNRSYDNIHTNYGGFYLFDTARFDFSDEAKKEYQNIRNDYDRFFESVRKNIPSDRLFFWDKERCIPVSTDEELNQIKHYDLDLYYGSIHDYELYCVPMDEISICVYQKRLWLFFKNDVIDTDPKFLTKIAKFVKCYTYEMFKSNFIDGSFDVIRDDLFKMQHVPIHLPENIKTLRYYSLFFDTPEGYKQISEITPQSTVKRIRIHDDWYDLSKVQYFYTNVLSENQDKICFIIGTLGCTVPFDFEKYFLILIHHVPFKLIKGDSHSCFWNSTSLTAYGTVYPLIGILKVAGTHAKLKLFPNIIVYIPTELVNFNPITHTQTPIC